MSLSLEQRLREFLASAPQTIYRIETLEISHSAMSKTFMLWREPYTGDVLTDHGVHTCEPVNMEIKLAGDEGHLDQTFDIAIDTTHIEDEFRRELDLIPLDTLEEITCIYREYLSDDLTETVAQAVLEVESITFTLGAAAISAVAPRFNMTRTGELYTPRDVPMLRAFL
jgi:hypothetical protein